MQLVSIWRVVRYIKTEVTEESDVDPSSYQRILDLSVKNKCSIVEARKRENGKTRHSTNPN
jgi:hypothetical protein